MIDVGGHMTKVKLFAFLPCAPGVTPEYFHQHWREVHSRLALQLPPIRRYIQFHANRQTLAPFQPSIYEGAPQVWYDSPESAASARTNPFYQVILADERKFLDQSRFGRVMTVENVKLEGDEPRDDEVRLKALLMTRKRPEASADDFTAFWTEKLDDLVMELIPGLVRYIRCGLYDQSLLGDRESTTFDGVLELWWDRTKMRDRDTVDVHAFADALADSPIDVGTTESMVGTEARIRWPGTLDDDTKLGDER